MEKPILFNTAMVQAILHGKKTSTRRIIKKKYDNTHIEWFTNKYGTRLVEMQDNVEGETFSKNTDGTSWQKLLGFRELKPPYLIGDVIYVRETWQESECFDFSVKGSYAYLANEFEYELSQQYQIKWRPSIHMPKVAARLFLKVTDVRAERLQDITEQEALKEGFVSTSIETPEGDDYTGLYAYEQFIEVWDKIYSKQSNGWDDNPWVWVIEFEKVKKYEL